MSDGGFAYGQDVVRQRRRLVADPYSKKARPGDWTDPESLLIDDASVASSSSRSTRNETRNQIITAKSLYCDPEADVRVGDRILVGSTVYEVEAKPEADVNPFTGWQPVQEIPLKEVSG